MRDERRVEPKCLLCFARQCFGCWVTMMMVGAAKIHLGEMCEDILRILYNLLVTPSMHFIHTGCHTYSGIYVNDQFEGFRSFKSKNVF